MNLFDNIFRSLCSTQKRHLKWTQKQFNLQWTQKRFDLKWTQKRFDLKFALQVFNRKMFCFRRRRRCQRNQVFSFRFDSFFRRFLKNWRICRCRRATLRSHNQLNKNIFRCKYETFFFHIRRVKLKYDREIQMFEIIFCNVFWRLNDVSFIFNDLIIDDHLMTIHVSLQWNFRKSTRNKMSEYFWKSFML